MTEPKKYRKDWTIEPAQNPYNTKGFEIQYYKGTIDMDNVHFCSTVEEAESDIDDYIILEQEQVIEKLRTALYDSNIYLIGADALLSGYGQTSDSLRGLQSQITENQRLIKAFQS